MQDILTKIRMHNMKTLSHILLSAMCVAIFCVGCSSLTSGPSMCKAPTQKIPKPPTLKVKVGTQATLLGNTREDIQDQVQEVQGASTAIKIETATGKEAAPDLLQWEEIADSTDIIDTNAQGILDNTQKIQEIEANLNTAQAETSTLIQYTKDTAKTFKKSIGTLQKTILQQETKLQAQDKEIQVYRDDVKKRYKKIWMSITAFSAVGLVIGIFLAIYASPKLGASLSVTCILIGAVSYFMSAYAVYVAMLGGAVVLGILSYLIYHIYINRKALLETILCFDLIKQKDYKDVKEEVNKVQSTSTRQIVQDIKLKERIGS